MPEPEPLFVLDSSVTFDLINGRLVLEVHSLPYVFAVPDILYEEEFDEKAKEEISKLDLVIMQFNGNQVAEVFGLKATTSKPSVRDLFAFVGAKDNQAILLTGDSELRKIAENNGLTVHGILWVLDELIQRKILIPGRAAHALREILIKRSFLPQVECIRRFQVWGETNEFWEDLF